MHSPEGYLNWRYLRHNTTAWAWQILKASQLAKEGLDTSPAWSSSRPSGEERSTISLEDRLSAELIETVLLSRLFAKKEVVLCSLEGVLLCPDVAIFFHKSLSDTIWGHPIENTALFQTYYESLS
jgi:hypothetical protein